MDLRVQFQHSESTFPTLIWPSNGPTNQDHLKKKGDYVRKFQTEILTGGSSALMPVER